MKKLLIWAALALLAGPSIAARIECITGKSTETTTCADGTQTPAACELSATAIKVRGADFPVDIEVYADTDAVAGPAGGVCLNGSISVTCAGWDTSGEVKVVKKCDLNAPWRQIPNTTNATAATGWGRGEESICYYALQVVDDGTLDTACFYLAVTAERSLEGRSVDDGETSGRWAVDRSTLE